METTKKELTIIENTGGVMAAVNQLAITSQDDLAKATDLAKAIRGLIKAAEDERKTLVQPLNDHVKMINARFKNQITDLLDKAKRALDEKMLKYQREENAKRQAEIDAENAKRRAEAEAERIRLEAEAKRKAEVLAAHGFADLAKEEAEKPIVVEVPEVKEEMGRGVRSMSGNLFTVRKVKDFELVDIKLVPYNFLQLNESWVRSAIQNGTTEIPGIRIFEKEVSSIR